MADNPESSGQANAEELNYGPGKNVPLFYKREYEWVC
jgi:hypothetical protein